jgi:drug/metabolite transporter (DMT)-like permease
MWCRFSQLRSKPVRKTEESRLVTSLSQSKEAKSISPELALIIALLAATFAAPLIKLSSLAGVSAPMIAASRLLLAALILSPMVWLQHREELRNLTRHDVILGLSGGLWVAIHFLLVITALEYTSVMLNQVLLNTGPIWTALAEMLVDKVRLSKTVWIGLLITFTGGVFIAMTSGDSSLGSNPMLGNILAVLGAMAGAIYMLYSRKVRGRISLVPYNWIAFSSGGFIALGYALLSGKSQFSHSNEGYLWLILLTIVPQLVGHTGFNYALRFVQATFVSLSAQILTVTSAIAAFLLFREVPTIAEIIGSVIIIIGVVIAITAPKARVELSAEL